MGGCIDMIAYPSPALATTPHAGAYTSTPKNTHEPKHTYTHSSCGSSTQFPRRQPHTFWMAATARARYSSSCHLARMASEILRRCSSTHAHEHTHTQKLSLFGGGHLGMAPWPHLEPSNTQKRNPDPGVNNIFTARSCGGKCRFGCAPVPLLLQKGRVSGKQSRWGLWLGRS